MTFELNTILFKVTPEDPEIVRKEVKSEIDFPWDSLFVCGYGVQRLQSAHAGYEKYSLSQAVKALFDLETPLQNPELIMLRQEPAIRGQLEEKLFQILLLEEEENRLEYSKTGLHIYGPWGKVPFHSLSEGYRSTMLWVLDFFAWTIYAGRFTNPDFLGGILLIDELEQHLHPQWQRYIVQRLRKQLPGTQIIVTTHTPLTASGTLDLENSLLVKLTRDNDSSVQAAILDQNELKGKRADQILASEAFDLVTSRSPGSVDDIDRYSELIGKQASLKKGESLSSEEERELIRLRKWMKKALIIGEGPAQQLAEEAVSNVLNQKTKNISLEQLDLETKLRVKKIFNIEES